MTQSTTTTDGRDLIAVRPGRPTPTGSTPDAEGTSVADAVVLQAGSTYSLGARSLLVVLRAK
jgi:hypothetical protein